MNIQRGRDHGLPGYVEYRKICQIGSGSSFNELKSNISPKVSTNQTLHKVKLRICESFTKFFVEYSIIEKSIPVCGRY